MTEHKIDLTQLKAHGKTYTEMRDGVISLSSAKINPLNVCKDVQRQYYVEMPARYRLPLRVDITVKLNAPSLFIMLGDGSVDLGYRRGRIEDILGTYNGKNIHFNSRVPINEFSDITLIYDLKEMQIIVNGEERYYSTNNRYMKAKTFGAMNAEGFPLKISCENGVDVQISQLSITEYDDSAGIVHLADISEETHIPATMPPTGKPTFESCIAELSTPLCAAITDMDGWLRSLRPLKFKRQIDKNGEKITYVAPEQGLSYQVYISGNVMFHTVWWYILTQGKPETWGRKADNMENTLNYLSESDAAFASNIFNRLYRCCGGYGSYCGGKTVYAFDGKKVASCHGKLYFNMNLSEFNDVKRFIAAVKDISQTNKNQEEGIQS
jgi:hypothetical protein